MVTKNSVILTTLFIASRVVFLLAKESDMDYATSQLDTPEHKTSSNIDRAMLLELAKAMMELKMATKDLKEVKAESARLNDLISKERK